MLLSLMLLAAAQPAPPPTLTLAAARATLVGRWQGKLEYRDYQSNRWVGLPMTVAIRDGGDGVTQLRVADFDDGPKAGTVRITTVSMLLKDGASESSVSFRKNDTPELSTARLRLSAAPTPARWVIVSEETGTDDNRPAKIRVTTTRDGNALTELKEVDFTDYAAETWLPRNRTTLTRAGD